MTTDSPPSVSTLAEQRVSTVVGDRLCIKCNFNLAGQPVMRENVYGMAIVRCPECSTVASLQEYPILGKWAGRFAAALSSLWLLVLIGGVFATAGLVFGISEGCMHLGCDRLAQRIAQAHADWYAHATPAEKSRIAPMYGTPAPASIPAYAQSWIDSQWWDSQNLSSFVQQLGGPLRAVDARMFEAVFWLAFTAAVLGAAWSIFLLHMRRRRLFLFVLLPLAFALLFAYISAQSPSRTTLWMGGVAVYSMGLAQAALWPWIMAFTLATAYIGLCIGAWFGRPFIRWLARMLLPPRMLGSLAYLWLAEGKPVPRPASARATR